MNKTQLAKRISDMLDVAPSPDCINFIDAFVVAVVESLKRGEPVQIQGLGTFKAKTWKMNPALRNTRTHKPLSVSQVQTVRFVISPTLRERLNNRQIRTERDAARRARQLAE